MKWLPLIPWIAAAVVLLPVFVLGGVLGYGYARARLAGERQPARKAAYELIPIGSSSVTGAELALDLATSGVPPEEQKAWVRRLWNRWQTEPGVTLERERMH